MSVEKVKIAADASAGVYVKIPAAILSKALEEAGFLEEKGSLAEHVAERLRADPNAVMHVHRDVHLGKLLGAAEPRLES